VAGWTETHHPVHSGGDNVLIGKAAGEYEVKLLGGPGAAQGNVVEIWGGIGTAPARDRHGGFHAFTDKGFLTATFLYATPRAEGLRQAVKLLNGEKIPPVIMLPTMLIDKNNAEDILKKNGLL
jgi:ABC-type sugar transport system substrate-binding protein